MLPRSSGGPLLPLVLLLAACDPDDGSGDPDAVVDTDCVDDAAFFAETVHPQVVQGHCMQCHTADGLAAGSDLLFVSDARPDHLEVNRAALADVAGLQRDGTSIVLLKPLGQEDHGGGAVLSEDDAAYAALRAFVDRLEDPVDCEGKGDGLDLDDLGVTQLSPRATARKAALMLAGRLPTPEELDRVTLGGENALRTYLWELMAEPAFGDRVEEVYNDVLHTDRYLNSADAIGIFDDDRFPGVYAYEGVVDDGDRSEMRDRINDAVAREPLELIRWVVMNDLPFTEVLTADYTLANDYTRLAYGLGGLPDLDDPATLEFAPASVPGFPHAGLLTTPSFLNRYPTTDTNRNRHRSWFFYKTFLATDILTFAERPIDPTTSSVHNPTLNDPQCGICHGTLDPVAGAFQNWDDEGRLNPRDEGWYGDMRPPGFGETPLPGTSTGRSLAWLAQQAVDDPRFPVATVRVALEAFTGHDLLTPLLAGDDPVLTEALALQDAWLKDVAGEFEARGHDLKYVVERIVLSHWFRAADDAGASPGALHQAGLARLLTPEELTRKIRATVGLPWAPRYDRDDNLLDDYRLLYGGIDSFGVTTRLTEPNGVMASVALRMATDVACEAVPRDFVVPADQRRLFPLVEVRFQPETDDGFAVPEVEARIRANLVHLHARLLGEDLAPDDPEIDETYALWVDTWRMGKQAVADETIDDRLDSICQATSDWWTGDSLPSDLRIYDDDDHTIRSWMVVVAYLLSDFRFLHE